MRNEIESLLFIKGLVAETQRRREIPSRGNPEQSQKKSLTDTQPSPVLTPSVALSTETTISALEKENTSKPIKLKLFLIFHSERISLHEIYKVMLVAE